MKKIFFTSVFALLTALSPLTADGGVDFSGDIESFWGASAPWTASDTAGLFLVGDSRFTGTIDAYWDKSSAFAEGSISYDAIGKSFNYSLGELWLDYSDSFWGIRIGRQKAVWGKADGIDVTNIICPKDMSSLSAMISDDSKLAIDAIRFSLTGNQFTLDSWWIPFFTASSLPASVKINKLENPELTIWNGEYALKLSAYLSMLDFSFYGFYGWDDLPFMDYNMTDESGNPLDLSNPANLMLAAGINVSGEYKHLGMLGADAALPLGETVIRLEAAFFPQRYFQKSSDVIMKEKMTAAQTAAANASSVAEVESWQRKNELSALAGIDWMPSGWTITAQYFCDYLFGDIEALERKDAYTHGASLSISKSLLNETMELSLSGIINFNAFDSLISPSVSYSLSDQINLSTGAYIFLPGPDEDGEYGAYKDYSSFYIKAKFSF